MTKEVVWLNAFNEEKSISTASTTLIDDNGYFLKERAEVRKYCEPAVENVENIDYVDVASNQIVSIATSLIPFLEHDDSVRALMGSNMQRQAVPCIKPDAPLVGTGVEGKAALDSGHVIVARRRTVVTLTASRSNFGRRRRIKTYNLTKFARSNANTCLTSTHSKKIRAFSRPSSFRRSGHQLGVRAGFGPKHFGGLYDLGRF